MNSRNTTRYSARNGTIDPFDVQNHDFETWKIKYAISYLTAGILQGQFFPKREKVKILNTFAFRIFWLPCWAWVNGIMINSHALRRLSSRRNISHKFCMAAWVLPLFPLTRLCDTYCRMDYRLSRKQSGIRFCLFSRKPSCCASSASLCLTAVFGTGTGAPSALIKQTSLAFLYVRRWIGRRFSYLLWFLVLPIVDISLLIYLLYDFFIIQKLKNML